MTTATVTTPSGTIFGKSPAIRNSASIAPAAHWCKRRAAANSAAESSRMCQGASWLTRLTQAAAPRVTHSPRAHRSAQSRSVDARNAPERGRPDRRRLRLQVADERVEVHGAHEAVRTVTEHG